MASSDSSLCLFSLWNQIMWNPVCVWKTEMDKYASCQTASAIMNLNSPWQYLGEGHVVCFYSTELGNTWVACYKSKQKTQNQISFTSNSILSLMSIRKHSLIWAQLWERCFSMSHSNSWFACFFDWKSLFLSSKSYFYFFLWTDFNKSIVKAGKTMWLEGKILNY